MENAPSIRVEVIYLGQNESFHESLEVPPGTTVKAAINLSGVLHRFPAFDLNEENVGVFSRKVGLEHVLSDGDRVELYRPLHLSPNEIRKLRAERRANRRQND